MWCTRCGYGNETYEFDHCGNCNNRIMTEKDPFSDARKKYMGIGKVKKSDKKTPTDNTSADVEAIVTGKVKPTVMR